MFEFEREKLAIAIEALKQAKQALSKAAIEDDNLFTLASLFHGLVKEGGTLMLLDKALVSRAATYTTARWPVSNVTSAPASQSAAELDVVSALINMQVRRQAAESAVRTAAGEGIALEFEPLFRRSLEVVQQK